MQDCLAYLLKLMSQFSVMPSDFETGAHDDIFDLLDSPVKKMRKNKPPVEKFVVPRLNKVMYLLQDDLFRRHLLYNICCGCCILSQLSCMLFLSVILTLTVCWWRSSKYLLKSHLLSIHQPTTHTQSMTLWLTESPCLRLIFLLVCTLYSYIITDPPTHSVGGPD